MTATTREREPRPPSFQHVLAVALELGIVAVLAAHHAWEGLVLAAGYAYFSATWAAVIRRKDDD